MGNCRSNSQSIEQQHGTAHQTKSRSNPFYFTNAQSDAEKDILSHYNFHSNYEDKFLGRCCVLEHKTTHNFYISKQIEFSSSMEYEKKRQQFLQIQEKINSQNNIRIKHIIQKDSQGFFFRNFKIIVIVDYPLTNLQRQYNSRLKRNQVFSRQEILNILISCVKGYSLIEKEREPEERQIFLNDKIRLKNIFFGIKDRDSLIKVAESSLLNEPSNIECIIKNKFQTAENRDIYLSPEEFQAVLKKEKRDRTFQKAGVFSLGMSLLDLCLMSSSREAYLYEQESMDFNEIRNRILIAGKNYGAIVQRFLGDMLEIDDHKRPNFQQLQQKIPSLLISRNENERSMNLSVAKSNTKYLRNDNRSIRRSRSQSRDSSFRSRSISQNSINRSVMNRSVLASHVSNVPLSSRHSGSKLGRRFKRENDDEDDLDMVHEIYDKKTGRKYVGQKKGTLKHGQGTYYFEENGSYYEGQWRNNKMEGKGDSYFAPHQLEYSGEWKADEYHGWGTLYTHPSSNSRWQLYEGEFKNGVKEGRGQMKFKNGILYDGEFRGDKIHGKGKVIKDGRVIKDEFYTLINPQTFLKEIKEEE